MAVKSDLKLDYIEPEEIPLLYTKRITYPDHIRSSVPQDLLEKLPKRDRDIVERLSILAQRVDWLTEIVVNNNDAIIYNERRLVRQERWRNALISRWSVLAGVIVFLSPYAVPPLLRLIFP